MKFEIYRSGLIFREWRFRIVARNGRILASSEGYKNKADAYSAVRIIQKDAANVVIAEKE